MINVFVNSVISSATDLQVLTAGMVRGRAIKFTFNSDWDNLIKTAVFTDGVETVIVPEYEWGEGNVLHIPPEVLTTPRRYVKCGAYGVDSNEELVIPTLWVDLGRVFPSASPGEYKESALPTPKPWDSLQKQIGVIKNLETEDKSSLVEALNEVLRSSVKTVNNVSPDENGNVTLDIPTASEIETVSDEDFLAWLCEAGIVTFLSSASDEIYVSSNNEIYIV